MRPSLDSSKDKLITEIIQFFDKENIERLARETGFVQRESKLQGLDFFLLCVFVQQKCPSISLNGLCGELVLNDVLIRKQSLQDRFNEKSVNFMRQVLGEALSRKLTIKETYLSTVFSRIIIGDSTVFQVPEAFENKYQGSGGGGSSAAVKIQYQFDVLSHDIIALMTQDGIRPDCKCPLADLRANDLRIEDLGYYKLDRLIEISQAGAFFVSRLKYKINAYVIKNGDCQQLNLFSIIKSMKVNQIKTFKIFIGEKEMFPVRLIVEKVPKKIADEKRRKLKTDKQNKRKGLSKERLAFCDMNVFITNTEEYQIPAEKVKPCYSLRWQIEIMFKVWKSIFHLDEVRPMRIERFECFHYGRLALIILSTNLVKYLRNYLYVVTHKELSELKAFKVTFHLFIEKYDAILRSTYTPRQLLENLLRIIERSCIKENKKNKPNPLNIITNLSLT